jgi:hypothetical protein
MVRRYARGWLSPLCSLDWQAQGLTWIGWPVLLLCRPKRIDLDQSAWAESVGTVAARAKRERRTCRRPKLAATRPQAASLALILESVRQRWRQSAHKWVKPNVASILATTLVRRSEETPTQSAFSVRRWSTGKRLHRDTKRQLMPLSEIPPSTPSGGHCRQLTVRTGWPATSRLGGISARPVPRPPVWCRCRLGQPARDEPRGRHWCQRSSGGGRWSALRRT